MFESTDATLLDVTRTTFAPLSPNEASSDDTGAASSHAAGGRSPHGPLMPGQNLGDRYHIVKLLGLGGMGAVYQAWDAELGVVVAVKVIRPAADSDPLTAQALERRFKQELLLARQVTHRNVVRIHDLGEIQGIKYITMPYIEGEDLATVLRREGKLPIGRTIKIARSMVSGLAAAHVAGVVHRDLKPANIMIGADGEAMIMDFGIARSITDAVAPGAAPAAAGANRTAGSGQTMAGAVVGTLEYMAPEQALAEPVDQRADIYALGLILYDLLLGRNRGRNAESTLTELYARIKAAPPSPHSIDPAIPDAFNRIITRCIQPDPGARYQTTAELAEEIARLDDTGKPLPMVRRLTRRMTATAVTGVLGLLGLTWWLARGPAPAVQRPPMSVLVADIQNKTGDPVFNGALEQALTIGIEGASFITAYPRTTAQQAAQKVRPDAVLDEATARLVSSSEGINVILAGAIESKGSGYTISVRAVDPANGNVLGDASATVRRKSDVLQAVGSVASELRGTLGDAAPESDKRAAAETVSTSSLEALADYSRAQDLLFNLKDAEAIPHYKRAIERDPNFGRAYAAWATAATNLGRQAEAAELWKKALQLLDGMTEREKYRTLANYNLLVTQNYQQAAEHYKYLLDKYPYDRVGHLNLALTYFYLREFDNALQEGKRSIEVDPKSLIGHSNYALYAMYAGDFETAAVEARKVIEQDPSAFKAYLPFAVAGLATFDVAAATDAYNQMAKANPEGASLANIGLADLAMYQGRFADAAAMLRSRISDDQKSNDRAYAATKHLMLAEAYEAEGKSAPALEAVRTALKVGPQNETVLVPAARLYLRLGKESEAAGIASVLSQRLESQSRAYGNIIEGETATRRKRPVDAITLFRAASKLTDLWLARMDLGIAYIEASHYAEGFSELDQCFKRRGEASAIFLDDVPTFRYLATLPYWLARAQEGLGQLPAAAGNYKTYLQIRAAAARDPLAADARRRLNAVGSTP